MLSHFLRAVPKGLEPIEFVSSSSNRVASLAANTVSTPSGIQENDILVAVWRNPDNLAVSSVPSGWSLVVGASGFFIYTKTATSSEPSDYTFTLSTSRNNTIGIVAYRNATSIAVTGSIQVNTAGNNITAPSITLSNDGALLALFGNDGTPTITSAPSGMTNRVINNGGPSVYAYDLIPSGTGATGNITATIGGTNDDAGVLIQLT